MTDTSPARSKSPLDNSEFWSGAVWLALGAFVTWSGVKLGIGRINDPGSGFMLFYVGILMCVFSVTIMIAAISEGSAGFGALWAGANWRKPLTIMICLAVFAVALEPLGFLLSTIPLLLVLLRAIDPVRWTLTIPIGVLAPLFVWWVLKKALLIQLPSGILEIG